MQYFIYFEYCSLNGRGDETQQYGYNYENRIEFEKYNVQSVRCAMCKMYNV